MTNESLPSLTAIAKSAFHDGMDTMGYEGLVGSTAVLYGRSNLDKSGQP